MQSGSGHSIGRRCVVRTLVAGSIPAPRRSFSVRRHSRHIGLREQPHNSAHDGLRLSFSGIDRGFDDAVDDFVNTLARQAEVVRQYSERDLFPLRGDGISGKRFDAP